MTVRRELRAALVALLMLLSACTLLRNPYADTGVTLIGLRPGPTEGLSQVLHIDLAVSNPGSEELSLAAIRYRIRIQGHDLVSGSSRTPLVVPAGGEAHYTLPARIDLLGGVAVVRALLSGPGHRVDYALEATLTPAHSWWGDIHVTRSGDVPLN